VFDGILRAAMSITGAPNASLLTVDEDSGAVVSRMRRDGKTFTDRIDPYDLGADVSASEEQSSAAGHDGTEPVVGEIPWLPIYRRLVPDDGSFLYVLMKSGEEEKSIGLLGIGSPKRWQFGPDDLRLLEALADQAAIAIQNARQLETVRVYQEQEVAAERIAALADVAGNMVQHINSAVGGIHPLIQQIETAMEQGHLNEAFLVDRLQKIRHSAEHAQKVVEKIQQPFYWADLDLVDVNASIAAAWAELTAPVGVEVRIEYGKDLPPVKATRQLDQVFRNLMKNALDAMSKKGGVLSVRNRRLNERQVEVVVQDTGPGIAPEMRDKVFHLGTTSKPGSTGFGLWWSRAFLRHLGGDMLFEGRNGKGCVFKVILPICET
jgi:signal transduction histidine kinase